MKNKTFAELHESYAGFPAIATIRFQQDNLLDKADVVESTFQEIYASSTNSEPFTCWMVDNTGANPNRIFLEHFVMTGWQNPQHYVSLGTCQGTVVVTCVLPDFDAIYSAIEILVTRLGLVPTEPIDQQLNQPVITINI